MLEFLFESFAERSGEGPLKIIALKIAGMRCEGCASAIRALLIRMAGVQRAAVSFKSSEARLHYNPAQTSEGQLVAAIQQVGYRVIDCSHE